VIPLPISVIVPHKSSREEFFRRYCLPSIVMNRPAELVVEGNDGSSGTGAQFRNAGALKATQPFIFFCDDDIILAEDCLARLLQAVTFSSSTEADVRYSYCDYLKVTMPDGKRIGDSPVSVERMVDFDRFAAKRGSVCGAMILIERSVFPGFDPSLPQLDDWDLVLTLLERGIHGVRVPEVLFHAYFLDDGMSDMRGQSAVVDRIKVKHGMCPGR
jgi:hypothetical protein